MIYPMWRMDNAIKSRESVNAEKNMEGMIVQNLLELMM
jgi:hypothetical protein